MTQFDKARYSLAGLLGSAAAVAVILFFIGLSLTYFRATELIIENERTERLNEATQIAIAAERLLGRPSEPVVRELLLKTVADEPTILAVVVNPERRIAIGTRAWLRDMPLTAPGPFLESLADINSSKTEIHFLDPQSQQLWVARAFDWPAGQTELRSTRHGVTIIAVDTRLAVRQQRPQYLLSTAATSGVYLIATLFFLGFLYLLLRYPLKVLERIAQDFGEGRFTQRVRPFALTDLNKVGTAFNVMADEINDAINEVKKGTERYQSLVQTAPSAILAIEPGGYISRFNRAAEQIFGYPMDDVLGRNYRLIFPNIAEPQQLLDLSTLECRTRAGQPFTLEINTSVVNATDGSTYTIIARDITERLADEAELSNYRERLEKLVEERTQELERQRDRANAATQAKSDFLANMSHEVRTPMNAVIGMLHLTASTELDARQKGFVDKALAAAQHLLTIINDILDFSKIEAGKLALESIDFELQAVLDQVVAMSAGRATDKGLELLVEVDPAIPATLHGDPVRLTQALLNYVGNAIKFTAKGSVHVRVRLESTSAAGVELRFAVTDTGIGINPLDQRRLFDSFVQVDASTTRKYGGSGLGLAITRQLATLMGGETGLESELGVGSTFWFTVRLPPGSAPASASTVDWSLLQGAKAVVVDDSSAARTILGEMLRGLGMEVEEYASGEHALAAIERARQQDRPFRFAFVDWRMPGMDGVELARRLLAQTEAPSPAIVLMTAFGAEELSSAARGLKIAGMLTKPTLRAGVLGVLGDLLGISPAKDSVGAPPERSGATTSLAGLNILVVEDNLLNQEVATALLEQAGALVTVADNGLLALQALEKAPFDVILMDMQMPVMDGLQATREIRRNPARASLPIIALTGNASAEDRKRCLDAGMNDHLGKPLDPEKLIDCVARWTGRVRPSSAQTLNPTGDLQGLERFPALARLRVLAPTLDITGGLRVVSGDAALYLSLLSRFAESQHDFSERFAAARRERDTELVRRLAHTLKGNAATLGAAALERASSELELAISRGEDDSRVAALIIRVELELAPLLMAVRDSLDETPSPDSVEADVSAPAKAGELTRMLRVLRDRLAADDATAVDYLRTHASMFSQIDVIKVRTLQGQIESFAFDEALLTIDELLSRESEPQ